MDTNALSAMADGDAKLDPILQLAAALAIPAIVLGEYQYGIRQSRDRTRYERWLAAVLRDCRVLVVDKGTAAEYAAVRAELKRLGRPIPANDLWIAALARQHSLPILSHDQHFDSVPKLKRVSW